LAPVTLGGPSIRRAAVVAVRRQPGLAAASRAPKLCGCAADASGRTTTVTPATSAVFRNARRSTAPASAMFMRVPGFGIAATYHARRWMDNNAATRAVSRAN
jgi:hypothetical protein